MDKDTLDELERVAREATPGPWRTLSDGLPALRNVAHMVVARDGTLLVYDQIMPRDATYIATFDPPTVLSLIAAARQQETVISDEVVERMGHAFWSSEIVAPFDTKAAMRAALSLLPRGEGSSRSLPSRTTQESPSPTPCDLEGK